MQTLTNLNDHHIWGGQHYPQDISTDTNDCEQATVVGRGQHDTGFQPLSQAGFIASRYDDLFNPTSDGPSSYVFNLPDVPHNPNPHYHAYNQPFSHPSPFSSYNNPSFTIPQPSPHTLYNNSSPLITSPLIADLTVNSLGQAPPIPYHS